MENGMFQLPTITFFVNGNPYSGSYRGMNYLATPVKADVEKDVEAHIILKVWYGPLCSDLADIVATHTVGLDTDGLVTATAWLNDQYAVFVGSMQ